MLYRKWLNDITKFISFHLMNCSYYSALLRTHFFIINRCLKTFFIQDCIHIFMVKESTIMITVNLCYIFWSSSFTFSKYFLYFFFCNISLTIFTFLKIEIPHCWNLRYIYIVFFLIQSLNII